MLMPAHTLQGNCFDLYTFFLDAAHVIMFYVVLITSPFLVHMPCCSETDESCKKQMERLLNIWKERSLYRADYIQQLKLAIEDNNSPIQRGSAF